MTYFASPGSTMKNKLCFAKLPSALLCALIIIVAALVLTPPAHAELCSNALDMDAATRGALERAALTYFDDIPHANSAALQQNSIPAVSSNFSGVQALVNQAAPIFKDAQATIRATYLLDAGGTTTLDR